MSNSHSNHKTEVPQAVAEQTNGNHPEGAVEDENAGGMWDESTQAGLNAGF